MSANCWLGGSERRRAHSMHDAHDRQVAVLDAGRVAEVGPASELTARDGGAFARLVQASFCWFIGCDTAWTFVLRGVNLDIPAGSRLALVGRTGSSNGVEGIYDRRPL
ncbi:hypothetical protein PPROV_000499400 [Pycnococcus provasolii]|uniref:Uncharacterized protein n=1 Tax=Pycnococcus provasolii TaxID=41880 RepID=A0A830HMJ7_9CHLO|nr:hypothetical protein PPROV_000499400 [Pycnococcus provasolii]